MQSLFQDFLGVHLIRKRIIDDSNHKKVVVSYQKQQVFKNIKYQILISPEVDSFGSSFLDSTLTTCNLYIHDELLYLLLATLRILSKPFSSCSKVVVNANRI